MPSTSRTERLRSIGTLILDKYLKQAPTRLLLIDAYLLFTALTAVSQVVYVLLVGTFPFNAFLSGLFSAVTSFSLGVNLRLQYVNPSDFDNITPQRAFADFVFCHMLLHFVVMTFIG